MSVPAGVSDDTPHSVVVRYDSFGNAYRGRVLNKAGYGLPHAAEGSGYSSDPRVIVRWAKNVAARYGLDFETQDSDSNGRPRWRYTARERQNPPALPVFVVGAPGGARKAGRGGADKIATRNKKQAFAIAYARSRAAGNARVGVYSHASEAIALRRWGPQLRVARGQSLPAIVAAQVAAFGKRL